MARSLSIRIQSRSRRLRLRHPRRLRPLPRANAPTACRAGGVQAALRSAELSGPDEARRAAQRESGRSRLRAGGPPPRSLPQVSGETPTPSIRAPARWSSVRSASRRSTAASGRSGTSRTTRHRGRRPRRVPPRALSEPRLPDHPPPDRPDVSPPRRPDRGVRRAARAARGVDYLFFPGVKLEGIELTVVDNLRPRFVVSIHHRIHEPGFPIPLDVEPETFDAADPKTGMPQPGADPAAFRREIHRLMQGHWYPTPDPPLERLQSLEPQFEQLGARLLVLDAWRPRFASPEPGATRTRSRSQPSPGRGGSSSRTLLGTRRRAFVGLDGARRRRPVGGEVTRNARAVRSATSWLRTGVRPPVNCQERLLLDVPHEVETPS